MILIPHIVVPVCTHHTGGCVKFENFCNIIVDESFQTAFDNLNLGANFKPLPSKGEERIFSIILPV